MMAAPRITSSNRWHLTRIVWAAELCLIPLSNNVASLILWQTGLALYPLLAALLYTYIGMRHLRMLPFGFVWSRRSVVIGIVAGLLLAAPAAIFLIHPIVVGNISYGPIADLSINGLMYRLLVDLPVLTAIVEELAFRHWLYFETKSLTRTLLINASLFTAWHGVAAFTSISLTEFGRNPGLMALSYVGSLGAVFVGGVVFALVRHLTGSFVYSALTHWLSDAAIVMVIWSMAHIAH